MGMGVIWRCPIAEVHTVGFFVFIVAFVFMCLAETTKYLAKLLNWKTTVNQDSINNEGTFYGDVIRHFVNMAGSNENHTFT